MTAKNRIILSAIAIITTLVVAGSMVFIIFAATRGQVTGGLTISLEWNDQLRGTVTTRYTTSPISKFGNGEGDQIIKTTDGDDYVEFKGWADARNSVMELESVKIDLSIDNPWVIFQILPNWTTGYMVSSQLSLAEGTVYENVEILVYGDTYSPPSEISADAFDTYVWNYGFPEKLSTSNSVNESCYAGYYYMIRVKDTTKSASFSGGIVLTLQGAA